MALRFQKSLDTRRAGLQVDAFAPAVTPKRAHKMLAAKGHGWVEWLPDARSTRIYGDRDIYLDLAGLGEDADAIKAVIEARMAEEELKLRDVLDVLLVGIREGVRVMLASQEDGIIVAPIHAVTAGIGYKVATRHGKALDGRYKLSFRPFFYGVRIAPYTGIPALFEMAWEFSRPADEGAMAAFWDYQVYRPGDQLLAAINGAKNPTGKSAGRGKPRIGKDFRVLEMASATNASDAPPDDLLDYVAQHVDEAWPLLQVDPERMALPRGVPNAMTTASTPEDVRYAVDLAACLSAARSSNREMWIRVGTILKHLTGDDNDSDEEASPLYAAFLAFSRLAGRDGGYKGDDDCGYTWQGLKPRGAVGLGSLVTFARQDDPQRADAAWRAHKDQLATAGTAVKAVRGEEAVVTPEGEARPDLAEALRTAVGGAMTSLPDDVRFVPTKDGTLFRFDGGCGVVMRGSNAVRFGPSEDKMQSVGNLLPTYHLPDCTLSTLDKSLLLRATHTCTVVSEQQTDVTAPHLAGSQVSIYDSHDPENAKAKLTLLGKTTFVDKAGKVAAVCAMMHRARTAALQGRFSPETSNMLLQNFGTINNNTTINVVLDPEANRHTDHDLIKAVVEANPVLIRRYKFAPDAKVSNCNGIFVCDPATNVWAQRHNVVVEEALIGMFAALTDVTAADRKHVESRRGRSDMLYSLGGKVVDEAFLARLDADLDLFACDNGVFDMRTRAFRTLEPEDWVATTSGWSYDAEKGRAHRAALDTFLAQVLPVPEERRVVLAFFASLLSGRRRVRKFMVFTDQRGGANGKSSLAALLRSFFGEYAKMGTKFVCNGSFAADRNSHGAGIEPFRGKRLVVAEELKHTMTLDVGVLKSLTGGASATVEDRKIGVGEQFKFVWQAGFLLIFNEGDCPAFDAADAAFVERMIVVPMRSKFVDAGANDNVEPYTFSINLDLEATFPWWRSALLDVLMECYGDDAALSSAAIPAAMKTWRHGIADARNPVAEWLDNRVDVTGMRDDVTSLGMLYVAARNDGVTVPMHRFFGFAKAFLTARICTVNQKGERVALNGAVATTVSNVVRGAKLRTGSA